MTDLSRVTVAIYRLTLHCSSRYLLLHVTLYVIKPRRCCLLHNSLVSKATLLRRGSSEMGLCSWKVIGYVTLNLLVRDVGASVGSTSKWRTRSTIHDAFAATTVHFGSTSSSQNTRGKPVGKARNTSMNSELERLLSPRYHAPYVSLHLRWLLRYQ